MSVPTPLLPRLRHYVPVRSLALYAAALVPLSAALGACLGGAGCDWYSLAVGVSLLVCGISLQAPRPWTGYLLLWAALILLLLFGFGDLGPGFPVLSSVIVLVAFGIGLLALTGRARRD